MILKFLRTPPIQRFILILPITIIMTYSLFITTKPYYQSDFIAFYPAAQIIIKEPQNLYNSNTQITYQKKILPNHNNYIYHPFINPPIYLLPWIPLTLINPQTAYHITVLTNILLILISFKLLNKHLNIPNPIITLILLFSFPPVYTTLFQTHSSAITLLIYCLTYLFLYQKKTYLTTITSSLLIYKPQLGILLWLYLLINYYKKSNLLALKQTTTFICCFIFLSLINIYLLQTNPINYLTFLHSYATEHDTNILPNIDYISIMGLTSQIEHYLKIPISYYKTGIFISLILVITTFLIIIKKPTKLSTSFTLIILTSLLAIPHMHHYELLLLILPLLIYHKKISSLNHNISIIILTYTILLLTPFSITSPHPTPFITPILLLYSYYTITKQLL